MSMSSMLVDSRRRAYDNAVRILEKDTDYLVNKPVQAINTPGKRNLRMAQANLVSIIPLGNNTTNYQLQVMDSQPNLGNSGILDIEKRMTIQDVFFTSSFGFFLVALNASTYNAIRFQFFCYPDNALGGVLGLGDPAALMGLWTDGNLEVKTSGEVVTPQWWLWQHLVINQTQDNIAGTPVNPFWSQQNFGVDGHVITEPNWIINGGNNNEFNITYGSNYNLIFGAGTANASHNYTFAIAGVWTGWLAQNASSIMNNVSKK